MRVWWKFRGTIGGALVAGLLSGGACPALAQSTTGTNFALTPHMARYALIKTVESGGDILRAAGELRGDMRESCAGWQQSQRRVLTIVQAGGQRLSLVKEFEAAEGSDRNSFAFTEITTLDGRGIDRRTGNAYRFPGGAVIVDLTEPAAESFDLPTGSVLLFPHLDRILRRATAGSTIDRSLVFDGTLSEALDVVSEIEPSVPLEIFSQTARELLQRGIVWPVKQLGFRLPGVDSGGSGREPLYRFDMKLHETGIAVELEIDLIDFALRGDLIEGRLLPRAVC